MIYLRYEIRFARRYAEESAYRFSFAKPLTNTLGDAGIEEFFPSGEDVGAADR